MNNQATDFKLKNTEGETVKLSDQKGKWMVLVFYRGNWCPKCNIQVGQFAKDYSKFQELNCGIFAISTDTPKGAKKTKEKTHTPFHVLIDEDNKVIQSYEVATKKREFKDIPALFAGKKAGSYAMPSVFIIDTDGIIRYSYTGKSFTDRPSNEQIIQELKELQES